MMPMNKSIGLSKLERMFLILADIKKDTAYDKFSGTWSWFDRSEEDNLHAWHTGFSTNLEAVTDAVEPYMENES